jgi:hypothetical protein
MPFTPQEKREYRIKIKERGLCTRCYKNKSLKGHSLCRECIDYCSKRYREWDRNFCWICGKPKDDPTKAKCVNCTQINSFKQSMRLSRI